MAVSSVQVRAALSLPQQPVAGPSIPNKSTRKPDGISRELYSLIGPSSTSLVAQLGKPRLKQKPNLSATPKVKWEWRSFNNGARTDSLQLNHWVKQSTDPSQEYQFARYNVQRTSYMYSDEEYTTLLQDEDWSREETDFLMNIVQEFDLRWHVIHDRYEFPQPEDKPPRTMEDLKDRYCSVCRKLIRSRPSPDEATRQTLLTSFNFEKDREVLRKKYLESLENRTAEQVAEEEALFMEIKRLEQNERRFKRERDELLRTLGGIESGLPEIIEDDAQLAGILSDPKRKKKGNELDSPSTPLSAPLLRRPVKSSAQDLIHCITRSEPPPPGVSVKSSHQPAFLRTFKIPYPKSTVAQKVIQAMTELGVSNTRLVMPTMANITHLENVMDAAASLVETKKNVDRVEFEIEMLQGRLGMQTGGPKTEDGGGTDAMEVDDADGEAEDGRAQSVVSTRSRKQRRSMSISSVDTSATVSTRAGTKRQRR
ncbi:Myb-like domain-containing protein [Mycena kentingensis (nom. inval.)]|nr:Myb-like domain-containing protein [Mycena kentingensis (nom. inval.)]